MKISINLKLFAVLLAFSLLPLFISRGLMGSTAHEMLGKMDERVRSELLDIVSGELEHTAVSLLTQTESGGNAMALASQAVAAEVGRILDKEVPAGAPLPDLERDFEDPELAPADAARRPGYVKRGMHNRQRSLRISLEHPTAYLPRSVPLERVASQLRRLKQAAPAMRRVLGSLPGYPYWINVALTSGVLYSLPGNGDMPKMYDPRDYEWFLKSKTEKKIRWYHSVDPVTRFIVNKVVFPIRLRDGSFVGAVSVDIPAYAMMPDAELAARWGSEVHAFLVGQRYDKGFGLPILAQQESDRVGRRHWMASVEQEWLTLDDPVGRELLLHSLDTRRSGVVRLSFRGKSSVCAFATNGTMSFLVIAPKSVVSQLPNTISTMMSGMFDKVREISALVSVIMLLITALMAWFGARTITRPLLDMTRSARRLSGGDFTAHIDRHTGDERDDLIDSFNEMGPKLKELMELNKDMELAQGVQHLLLPGKPPELPGFELAGGIEYCEKTGGDYYDFLRQDSCTHRRLGVVLGDVSGHGLPSALVMAAARGQLHTLAPMDMAPEERINTLNRVLCRDLEDTGRFITLFYLCLSEHDPLVQWVRAGHDPAVRYNPETDEFGELRGEGIPLGVIEDHDYLLNETTLADGEVLVMATDGVWEARNQAGEMFGKQRMLAIVRENAHHGAEPVRRAIMAAVEEYQGHGQEDDMAVVVVRKVPSEIPMPRDSVSFRLTNKQNCFKRFQPEVETFGERHGLPRKIIFHLTLVLDELITNIISYGYADYDEHPIDVTVAIAGDELSMCIVDDAKPFNILEAPGPELDVPLDERAKPVGGMGVHLIKNLVHGIEYRREGGKNILTLSKNLNICETHGHCNGHPHGGK